MRERKKRVKEREGRDQDGKVKGETGDEEERRVKREIDKSEWALRLKRKKCCGKVVGRKCCKEGME